MKRSPRVCWVENQVQQRYSTANILDAGFLGSYEEPFLHLSVRRQNPKARIIGIDLNLEKVLKLRLSNTLVADAGRLPFKNNSFDCILCLELLEHLHYCIPTFTEFWRVLRPDGSLVVTTPNSWSWWGFFRNWMIGSLASRARRTVYRYYLGDNDHKQFYDPLSLMNILDDAGFQVICLTTKNHAIPLLRRYFKRCDLIDWHFYPMNRLGGNICLIVQKTHSPRTFHK